MSMHSDLQQAPSYSARFTDGLSAASHPVEARLGERGIEIRRPAGDAIAWPYDTLTCATPLGAKTADVLLGCEHQKGATLFVQGRDFAAGLARCAPHLTARSTRWRHAAPWLGACAGVLALLGLAWLVDFSPAHAVAHLLPQSTRNALGGQVIKSMTGSKKICDAPAGRAALDTLVKRLADVAQPGQPFRVVVVDWSLINAFAAPGEQIVMTRGIISKAGGPDEVAGILAHEMGHGLELHPETGIVRAIGLSAAIELMSGGSSGTFANIGVLLATLSYTRAAERQADAHALRLLRAAQISQQGIIDFFTRVEKMDKGDAQLSDILQTHPQLAERRKLAEAAPRYPSTPALSNAEWEALKSICSVP